MGDNNNPTEARKYRIICLKRSNWEQLPRDGYISDWYDTANLFYWRPDRAGYTQFKFEAGLYTLEELSHCAGSHGDWLIEPVWVKE
jgi:hypothetical protein